MLTSPRFGAWLAACFVLVLEHPARDAHRAVRATRYSYAEIDHNRRTEPSVKSGFHEYRRCGSCWWIVEKTILQVVKGRRTSSFHVGILEVAFRLSFRLV